MEKETPCRIAWRFIVAIRANTLESNGPARDKSRITDWVRDEDKKDASVRLTVAKVSGPSGAIVMTGSVTRRSSFSARQSTPTHPRMKQVC